MPVIALTLPSWRSEPFSVAQSPNCASLSHGRPSLLAALARSTISRGRSSVSVCVRSLRAH